MLEKFSGTNRALKKIFALGVMAYFCAETSKNK
jgi:hypothetical protein